MDIRYINKKEGVDFLKVSSASFIWKFNHEEDTEVDMPVMGAFQDGKLIAGVEIFDFKTNYCGNILDSVVLSGVCSLPEHRRAGGIRSIFEKIEDIALENNWSMGFLQPFSISYYEKFGFANLNRMFAVKVPFENLNHIPRNTDVELYTGEQFEELCQLHNKCALKENLVCLRNDKKHFCDKPLEETDYTYISRASDKTANGYVRFRVQRPDTLTVEELYCLTPEALYGIIGFLRNYDGIVKHLIVKNQYQGSPFACVADRLNGVTYEYGGGAAGRIYNIKKILESNKYPAEYGSFSLKCIDKIPHNNGIFDVEYENGKAKIGFRADGEYDISLTPPAAARLLLAGEGHTKDTAIFIDGVEICGNTDAFFKAFPKRATRFADSFWSV